MLFPFKFRQFHREYHNREFKYLDVGCGDHSAEVTKKYFPNCRYFGVDRSVYNNSESDFKLMEKFYKIDLASEALDEIPDGFFDIVMFSHVIEHLPNGQEVLAQLLKKVAPEGRIYVEFPAVRSLSFPSAKGTLNFCDDATHIRLHDIKDVANTLLAGGFRIIRGGVRRDPLRVMLSPIALLRNLFLRLAGQRIRSSGLWDLYGFAEFVYARKRP